MTIRPPLLHETSLEASKVYDRCKIGGQFFAKVVVANRWRNGVNGLADRPHRVARKTLETRVGPETNFASDNGGLDTAESAKGRRSSRTEDKLERIYIVVSTEIFFRIKSLDRVSSQVFSDVGVAYKREKKNGKEKKRKKEEEEEEEEKKEKNRYSRDTRESHRDPFVRIILINRDIRNSPVGVSTVAPVFAYLHRQTQLRLRKNGHYALNSGKLPIFPIMKTPIAGSRPKKERRRKHPAISKSLLLSTFQKLTTTTTTASGETLMVSMSKIRKWDRSSSEHVTTRKAESAASRRNTKKQNVPYGYEK
ncbi:hypothetical protein V1477_001243 [Vespula maculifrons]|uniref:Uncharacterized protein n=1 Tax=Vespula maculifrons TaxID=7453 RepID=A0ABD2D251_VESMC